uniref:Taste receptor type 2 n=1 Tax=Latimeria chalumnae TaxID=7897 RepID=H2ZTI2_LATCH
NLSNVAQKYNLFCLLKVFLALLGNFFTVLMNLLEFKRSRSLQPNELIMLSLTLSNGLAVISYGIWFVIYLMNFCPYFGDTGYQVLDFLSLFLTKTSYWFTAWICCYYCVKVVKVKWRFFMRLKQRIHKGVNTLIVGTVLGNFVICLPIVFNIKLKTNSTNLKEQCRDYYVLGSSTYIHATTLSVLTSFLPLVLMLISSTGIVVFLCKHSRTMNKNSSSGATSHSDAPTAVAKMIVALIILYIICTGTVFALSFIVTMVESDTLIVISYMDCLYSAGSSTILIVGTVKLRQS